jgi:hypothetical protein
MAKFSRLPRIFAGRSMLRPYGILLRQGGAGPPRKSKETSNTSGLKTHSYVRVILSYINGKGKMPGSSPALRCEMGVVRPSGPTERAAAKAVGRFLFWKRD